MAFTTPRTWTYGETVTEAQFNEQIRDNFNAVWVGTTAGDIDYYTSNTTKARLAGGTANAGKFVRLGTGGTALEYASGGVLSYRIGGGSVDWSQGGTNIYEVTESVIRVGGARAGTIHAGVSASLTTAFPISFSGNPIVHISIEKVSGDGKFSIFTADVETSGFKFGIYNWSTTDNLVYKAVWTAEGPA
jgi:hypothetical protein